MLFALALITATPATAIASITRARDGDTIVFAPGNYGPITIKGRMFRNPVTFRLGKASLQLAVRNSSGLHFQDGIFTGPNAYAAHVVLSRNIRFQRAQFVDSRKGLILDRSQDVEVSHSQFARLTADGLNIALSQRVSVTDNVCRDFITAPPTHPDCIQGWSRPGGITSDVLVARNVMRQPSSQGIFFGNHVREGVDDGGYDRITIVDNLIEGRDHPQGIGLYACRNCQVARNRVITMPGARWKVNLVVKGGTVRQAGNVLTGKPR